VHGEVAALEALSGVEGVVPLLEYGLLMPQQKQGPHVPPLSSFAAAAAAATLPTTNGNSGSNNGGGGAPRYCLVFPRYRCSLAAWRAAHGRGLPSHANEAQRRVRDYLLLFSRLVAAVEAVHRAGVVHFDLKCDNVLCDPVPPSAASASASSPAASACSASVVSASCSVGGGGGGVAAASPVAAGAASAALWLRRSRTPGSAAAARGRSAGSASASAAVPSSPLDPPKKLVLADFGEAVVFGPAFTVGERVEWRREGDEDEEDDEGGGGGGGGGKALHHPPDHHPPLTAAAAAAALALARRARGTELFSAPEVLLSGSKGGAAGDSAHPWHDRRRHRGAGSAADVWSLGCALFQLLTGAVLFEADGHAAVARVVGMTAGGGGGASAAMPPPILSPQEEALLDGHPALRGLVLFALVRDPRRRPTAADLRRRVVRVMEQEYGGGMACGL
jgi:serine/threonine protein kinase